MGGVPENGLVDAVLGLVGALVHRASERRVPGSGGQHAGDDLAVRTVDEFTGTRHQGHEIAAQ